MKKEIYNRVDFLLYGRASRAKLAHQRMRIALRVLEESHPRLEGLHFRDEMRLVDKLNAFRQKLFIRLSEIVHLEIQHGARFRKVFILRTRQHEPYTAAF